MSFQKKCFSIMLSFFVLLFLFFPLIGNEQEEPSLQEKTFKILKELDELSGNNENLNALFSDQSEENFRKYKNQYCTILEKLERLKKLGKEWENKIKEDNNDKVYRMMAATIELAKCSIYSQPDRYLTFFKLCKTEDTLPACVQSEKHKNLMSFYNLKNQWKGNLDSAISRARKNINKVLNLDDGYEDACLLEIQLLVFEKNYNDALKKLEIQQDAYRIRSKKDTFFEEKWAFFKSWQAYIYLKTGKTKKAIELLRQGMSASDPPMNANWMSMIRSILDSPNTNLFLDKNLSFQLFHKIPLPELKKKSLQNLKELTKLLRIHNPKMVESNIPNTSVTNTEEISTTVPFDLEMDASDTNIDKYMELFSKLLERGLKLEECMDDWDEFAKLNHEAAYYYLTCKISCALLLGHMVNITQELVEDGILSKELKRIYVKGDKQRTLPSQWKIWNELLRRTIPTDLEKIFANRKDFLFAHLLQFEYSALYLDPNEALTQLRILSKKINRSKKGEIYVFPNLSKISANAYFDTWKSYLLYKNGDLLRAELLLRDSPEFINSLEWKAKLKLLIDSKKISESKKLDISEEEKK